MKRSPNVPKFCKLISPSDYFSPCRRLSSSISITVLRQKEHRNGPVSCLGIRFFVCCCYCCCTSLSRLACTERNPRPQSLAFFFGASRKMERMEGDGDPELPPNITLADGKGVGVGGRAERDYE